MNTSKKRIEVAGFSDKLKDVCHLLYGWGGLQNPCYYETAQTYKLKDIILPILRKTPREIWIGFSEHTKKYDPEIYVNALLKQKIDYLIIKDLRFPVEVDRIWTEGGFVCKMENSRIPDSDDEADTPLVPFTGWNYIFHNEGTLSDLQKMAQNFGDLILKGAA